MEQRTNKALNLTIHLIWLVLGAIYLIVCFTSEAAPFAAFTELTESSSFAEYVLLGSVIPTILFILSIAGVVGALLIPITCFNANMTYQFALSGIGAIIALVGLFSDEVGEFVSNNIMDKIGVTNTLPSFLIVIFIALPLFAGYLFITPAFEDSNKKSLVVLGASAAVSMVLAALVFVTKAFEYVNVTSDGMFGGILVWVVIGVACLLMPTATYVIIIIIRKD